MQARYDLRPEGLATDQSVATATLKMNGQPMGGGTKTAPLSSAERTSMGAVVSALALGALAVGSREPETGAAIALGDALGFPTPVTTWVSTGQTPTIEELVVAMEERNR